MSDSYYLEVAGAFDRAAASYVRDYGSNPIQSWLDDETFALLTSLFPAPRRLLEVGCGAGIMAARLASEGHQVVATDVSPAMVEAGKAFGSRLPAAGNRLTFVVSAAGDVAENVTGLFDGAYSGFGPLNCEPDLALVRDGLAARLRSGAPLAVSVMNRWCAWELGLGLARMKPRDATRRLRRGWVMANMSSGPGEAPSQIPVRYYGIREFASAFSPAFTLERALAFPVLIPPPYAATRFPSAARKLAGSERAMRGLPGFKSLGDHFFAVLRRV
jgi:SAM-dependent methyltransferase